jgi:triacylglycerol lipase
MRVARLQQITTVLTIVLAVGWAAAAVAFERPRAAAFGALLILGGYALFLAIEFMMLAFVHGDDPSPRATPWQLFRAWIGEVVSAPRVFCWDQPFRTRAVPDQLRAAKGRRAVVLVHGFLCNRAFWNPWMRRLRDRGIPYVAVTLEPVAGPISRYVDSIEEGVRRAEAATGLPPVIVGHSMGGLAIRAWIGARQSLPRVHRVVTIGAPHHGTWLAHFGASPNVLDMRLAPSEWRKQLAENEPDGCFERFTCYYSHCDNISMPPSTATLPGADNRHVPGMAHVHLAAAPQVFDEVVKLLEE